MRTEQLVLIRTCGHVGCVATPWCRGLCYRHWKQLWQRARRGYDTTPEARMAKIPASINLNIELVEDALQDPADWLQGARCTDMPYAPFFPEGGNEAAYKPGIRICEGCPVRWQCLAANLDETHGCFGGTTPGQRKAVRNTIVARRQDAAA